MSGGATRAALRTIGGGLRQLLKVRWVRVVVILALLGLGARLALVTLLSTVVSRVAAQRDLTVSWEDLDLSLLGGSGNVSWLTIAPLAASGDPGPPLLELEYAVFDLDVLHLVRGKLSLSRAEVDGADLYLERDDEGRWNFEQHVAAAEVLSLLQSQPQEEPLPTREEPEPPRPLELIPPVAIEALRLQHARLHLADRAVVPERRFTLEAGAWLSSLRTSDRPTRFGLELFGGELLDTARLEGEARWKGEGLSIDLTGQVGAQRLAELADYLEPLRIRPAAATVEATFRAQIELEVVGEQREALSARVELRDARILTDGMDRFALGQLNLDVEALSSVGARITALEVSGARGGVELRPDGALRLAGVDLLAPPREARPPLAWEDVVASVLDLAAPGNLPPWIALLGHPDPRAWPWSVERLAARDCAFEVVDGGVEPPARFELRVDQAEISGLVHDPGREPRPIPFSARLAAPGLAESLTISGSLQPWAPARRLEVEVALAGIAPAAADVYLESSGLERVLQNGRLELAFTAEAREQDGVTRASIETREVALEDSGELFGVRELAVRDIVIDPQARKLRLGEMVVSGPRLAFVRDPAESFLALGLRIGARTAAAPSAVAGDGGEREGAPSGAPVARAVEREPVVLEIGRAAWLDSRITFVDQSTDPPTEFALDELGLELTGLVLGGDPAGPAPPPARLTGGLRAEGLADRIALEGTVRSRPGTLDLEAEVAVRGEGLRGALLAPYLRPFGITPLLEQGRLTLQAVASLRAAEAGWVAGLRLEQAELTEGERPLLGLERLEAQGVVIPMARGLDAGISVDRIALIGPFAHVARDVDGGLKLGGLRLEPGADEPAEAAPAAPMPLNLPRLPNLRVGDVQIEGARLVWEDATFEPPLELELELAARAGPLSTRGETGTFELDLAIPGALASLELTGLLSLAPELVSLDASLAGTGLQAGPLARLLPPGLSFGERPGALSGLGSLEVRPADEGGLALRAELKDLSWGDGSAPWIGCGLARLELARLDPLAGVLELTGLDVEGVVLALRRERSGAVSALGLRVDPGAGADAPAQPRERARRLPGRAGTAPTRVAFGAIHVGVERFALSDESLGDGARPLAGTLALSIEPGVALDEDPAGLEPIAWRVEGALEGLVERWVVAGTLAPFATEPRLSAELSATGVRTQGLVELAPALAAGVRGEVEAGEVSGRLEGVLSVRRSHAADLALDRPFGGELRLAELHFRDAPGGEVLLGVDGVDVEARRIDPATGDVHLDLVEVRTPRARLWREGLVVHAAGLAVDLAAPTAELDSAGPDEEAQPELAAPAEPTPPDAATPPAPASDLRVDRIVLSGIDVEIADRTGTPELLIPLAHLELETGRISTRDLLQGGTLAFSGEVGARSVEDQPPVFEELSLAGRIAPLPAPKGWLQLTLSGLELVDFSGLAAEQGLALDDGALDLSTRLRLKGERGAGAGVTVVFSDLDVSEPEGGLLESLLSLPVTLDTALFLLRNADGEHRLSVDVDVGPEGIGAGAIATAAASAMVQVVVGAVAGAPLRLIGSVLPGGGDEERPREVVAFAFAPGASELDAAERARLAELAWRLHTRPSLRVVVRHELTTADLGRAARLANPAREECLELVARLRQRKAELWRQRDALASQARALYAVGTAEATPASAALRAVSQQLHECEVALDRVLEVLRRDSPRQQAKRTRAAARAVSELRLEAIVAVLRAALAESRPERLELRPPRSTALDEPTGGRVLIELIER